MGSPTAQSGQWGTRSGSGGMAQQGPGSSAASAAEAGAAWGAYQGTEAALRAQMALGLLAQQPGGGLDGSGLHNAAAQVWVTMPCHLPTCWCLDPLLALYALQGQVGHDFCGSAKEPACLIN